jgi:hypothetical protein
VLREVYVNHHHMLLLGWLLVILISAVVGGVIAIVGVSWLLEPQVTWVSSGRDAPSRDIELAASAIAITAQPAETRLSPAALLKLRWRIPPDIAREVGQCIDYIMRDFVMSWFNIGETGIGISNDPQFLEAVQVRAGRFFVGVTQDKLDFLPRT